MTGMVDALHRICLTRRYRSYSGFMSCLSAFVILKEKTRVSVEQACVIALENKYMIMFQYANEVCATCFALGG